MPANIGNRPYDYSRLVGQAYEDVLNILGATGVIIPLTDKNHGALTASQTTIGDEQVVFTMSEAISSFDSPPTAENLVPVVKFNGIDEEGDTPDTTYWTRILVSASWGAWVRMVDATSNVIMAKYDATTGALVREWRFYLDASDRPVLELWDESIDAAIGRRDATALTELVWHFLVATYDSTVGGGATAASIKLYLDGAAVDDTDQNTGVFVAMEDLAVLPTLGFEKGAAANELFFDGSMAGGPLGPFYCQKTLSLDEIKRLYNLGRLALGV
jgi:hypothetical protein